MLAANETVARHMELKEEPFVYRVHEAPVSEKIERFQSLLAALGLRLNVDEDGKVRSRDIQQVLDRVKGAPEERIIGAVALRSMQQARYAPSRSDGESRAFRPCRALLYAFYLADSALSRPPRAPPPARDLCYRTYPGGEA